MTSLSLSAWGLPKWRSGKESACQCRRCKRCGFDPWVGKISWSRKWQPIAVFLRKPYGQRGAWWATVHRVTKSRTQLRNLARTHSGTHKPFGLPRWFNGKEPTYQCRRLGFSPLEKEMATQVQYPCLENPMDRGAWWAMVHGVAKELDRT